jgi:citronellol/citronellal dehydrogenase
VAAEVEAAGGKALAIQLDVRDENAIVEAMNRAASHFGGPRHPGEQRKRHQPHAHAATPAKRFDLMSGV